MHSRATDLATLVYKASERNSWTEQTHRVPISVCNKPATTDKWTPSIHMPHWASRITLEITDVRVERLNDIRYDDAIAEGIRQDWTCIDPGLGSYAHKNDVYDDYAALWKSIYGEESWHANPWLWVIKFKRIEGDDHATD